MLIPGYYAIFEVDMKIDDMVETINGVGRIEEIRDTPGGTVVLVEIQPGGFGRGCSEVFSIDEICVVE